MIPDPFDILPEPVETAGGGASGSYKGEDPSFYNK